MLFTCSCSDSLRGHDQIHITESNTVTLYDQFIFSVIFIMTMLTNDVTLYIGLRRLKALFPPCAQQKEKMHVEYERLKRSPLTPEGLRFMVLGSTTTGWINITFMFDATLLRGSSLMIR